MKKNQTLQRPTRASILRDERGLSTVEYVVLLVLICAACVGLWSTFGSTLTEKLGGASDEFESNVPTYGSGSENR